MDNLLPAATLRAGPPSKVTRASNIVLGLFCVLAKIPLCSYVRVKRLQGIALASNLSCTDGAACFVKASSMARGSSPAVLLSCWALLAEPPYWLGASQRCVLRVVVLSRIALVIPLRQKSCHFRILALRKSWALEVVFRPCHVGTGRAASLALARTRINSSSPLVSTHITEPANNLVALCYHTVRTTNIFLIVPLSCNPRSFGSQGVVLAYFLAAALRASTAGSSVGHSC